MCHALILLSINPHTKFGVPGFTSSKDMIGQNLQKKIHITLTTPISEEFVVGKLALDIFYIQTKFVDSRFNHSGDMIAGIEIKNGSCDPGHAF